MKKIITVLIIISTMIIIVGCNKEYDVIDEEINEIYINKVFPGLTWTSTIDEIEEYFKDYESEKKEIDDNDDRLEGISLYFNDVKLKNYDVKVNVRFGFIHEVPIYTSDIIVNAGLVSFTLDAENDTQARDILLKEFEQYIKAGYYDYAKVPKEYIDEDIKMINEYGSNNIDGERVRIVDFREYIKMPLASIQYFEIPTYTFGFIANRYKTLLHYANNK